MLFNLIKMPEKCKHFNCNTITKAYRASFEHPAVNLLTLTVQLPIWNGNSHCSWVPIRVSKRIPYIKRKTTDLCATCWSSLEVKELASIEHKMFSAAVLAFLAFVFIATLRCFMLGRRRRDSPPARRPNKKKRKRIKCTHCCLNGQNNNKRSPEENDDDESYNSRGTLFR